MRLGERLGVVALATEDMPFLNAWYANEFGALLFEGAKIHGTSPSAYLSVIKRHYRELSEYLKRSPEEVHLLYQRSFGQEAPGNVPCEGTAPQSETLIKAIYQRYDFEAYVVRRHLIHFYWLTAGLLFSRAVRQVREKCRTASSVRVLDAGCGNGALVRRVLQSVRKGCRVVGTDIGWSVLKFAKFVDRKRGTTHSNLLRSDIEKLPFHRGAFDIICCFEVMEHVPAPESALREFHRVLKPHGALMLSWSGGANLSSGHVSAAGSEEIRERLRANEFSVKYLEEIPAVQTTFVEAKRSSRNRG